MKNIFLTGISGCGKTTLINKILDDLNIKYSGYRTKPYYIKDLNKGFYMEGYIKSTNNFSPISIKFENKKPIPILETFEVLGCEILRESINDLNSKLILMDEIGVLEDKALNFKNEIIRSIESQKIVLGVIKKKDNEFLNYLKERKDIVVFDIENTTNKQLEEIYFYIINEIKDYL
ncbi:nucleoside-triphosphatase [Clostridium sp. Ade.TY]|uniref:nucleoside-triphosphatase n=1 Tax=Clostridium sp. Ade.TY TaxID=1391647 RepID=UPI00041D983E|nr:nucleoside-triphosphatase [Clostridium sp. Ade.TY]